MCACLEQNVAILPTEACKYISLAVGKVCSKPIKHFKHEWKWILKTDSIHIRWIFYTEVTSLQDTRIFLHILGLNKQNAKSLSFCFHSFSEWLVSLWNLIEVLGRSARETRVYCDLQKSTIISSINTVEAEMSSPSESYLDPLIYCTPFINLPPLQYSFCGEYWTWMELLARLDSMGLSLEDSVWVTTIILRICIALSTIQSTSHTLSSATTL